MDTSAKPDPKKRSDVAREHVISAILGAAPPVALAAFVSLRRSRVLRDDLDALATRVLELETVLEAERALNVKPASEPGTDIPGEAE